MLLPLVTSPYNLKFRFFICLQRAHNSIRRALCMSLVLQSVSTPNISTCHATHPTSNSSHYDLFPVNHVILHHIIMLVLAVTNVYTLYYPASSLYVPININSSMSPPYIHFLFWEPVTFCPGSMFIFFSTSWGSKCSYFVLNYNIFFYDWKSTSKAFWCLCMPSFQFKNLCTCKIRHSCITCTVSSYSAKLFLLVTLILLFFLFLIFFF